MPKRAPIILIEDDQDDIDVFTDVVRQLNVKNEIKWFPNTERAFTYLSSTKETAFLIFCDINLPGKNGIEFKRDLDTDPELRTRSIPFLFYSTAANQDDVDEAYAEMAIQGFFKKEVSHARKKSMLKTIFDYWLLCKHPND
jgi:CheY-like chemotaxis protein